MQLALSVVRISQCDSLYFTNLNILQVIAALQGQGQWSSAEPLNPEIIHDSLKEFIVKEELWAQFARDVWSIGSKIDS